MIQAQASFPPTSVVLVFRSICSKTSCDLSLSPSGKYTFTRRKESSENKEALKEDDEKRRWKVTRSAGLYVLSNENNAYPI